VTSKGAGAQEIFKDHADYAMYLNLLKSYRGEHPFKLYAYCLVPDRLHLVIETGDDPTISEIMHNVNSSYTKYFNGRYGRRGPLFESRFRSVFVEKANYLLPLTRYVHRVPAEKRNYPYSSLPAYLSGAGEASPLPVSQDRPDLAVEAREVTGLLAEPGAGYARYCLEGDAQEIEALEKRLRRGSFLGSESFEEAARSQLEAYAKTQREEVLAAGPRRPPAGILFLIGLGIAVTSASSFYLYVTKGALRKEYQALLRLKEAEFAEKTRFENVSPIALTDLDGTEWEIEMVPQSPRHSGIVKDRIRFRDGSFSSRHFGERGFSISKFTVLSDRDGGNAWKALQTDAEGRTVSWRGDWRGDVMKGAVNESGEGAKYYFFSSGWEYVRDEAKEEAPA
jgi:REP element-mobilizing transposase RayT